MKRTYRQGSCLVLSWGPPWNWLPSFEKSRHCPGAWSLTWLWWGLCYVQVSYSTLMLHGGYPRCQDCHHWRKPDQLVQEQQGNEVVQTCVYCIEDRARALKQHQQEHASFPAVEKPPLGSLVKLPTYCSVCEGDLAHGYHSEKGCCP